VDRNPRASDAYRDRIDDMGELSGLIALFPPPVICSGRVFPSTLTLLVKPKKNDGPPPGVQPRLQNHA